MTSVLDEIKILVKAEVASAIKDLDKLEKQTDKTKKTSSTMMEKFGKMRDVMQGPVAAFNMVAGAVTKVAGELDKYIMIAAEAEKAQAILNSTLTATGANAWTSANKLNNYASAMAEITLYDDDAIAGMQGILLGFRNITGINFDRASTEILNMAQVMGMDLTSAAQAVGKALDSPATGMDSLSKQGFKFSASEKELIRTLVETNRLGEAQDIILKELSKTYGGAATAAADTATGSYLNMKKALGEVNEAIGIALANSGAWSSLGKFFNEMAAGISNINKAGSLKDKVKELQDLMGTRGFQAKGAMAQADAISKIGLNAEDAASGIAMLTGMIAENEKEQDQWFNKANPLSGLNKELDKENESLRIQKKNLESLLTTLANAGDIKAKNALIQKNADEAQAKADAEAKARLESFASIEDDYWMKLSANLAKEIEEQTAARNKKMEVQQVYYDSLSETGHQAYEDLYSLYNRDGEGFAENEAYKREEDQKTFDQIKANQEKLANVVMSGLTSIGEAFGTALVEGGEEGWKAFGKAGLNAVASVVEAFAAQYAAVAVANAIALNWPGAALNASAAVGLSVAAGGIRAIPMAEGGSGRVTKPTLFLAGEAGPESYAFGGANDKAMGKTVVNNFHLYGSPWAIKEAESMVVGAISKANRGY